ncbi:MAG: UPF0280 family protein [Desulfococcaceae bacterium]
MGRKPDLREYRERAYRSRVQEGGRAGFRVAVQETDLFIHADRPLEREARDAVLAVRGPLENYIRRHPDFLAVLTPWTPPDIAPGIAGEMAEAGRKVGVGPMAAVAGAVAAGAGKRLLAFSEEVIVENGGDVFLHTRKPVTVALFAGKSPLSLRVGVQIDPAGESMAICTSSGTVGHSLSRGKADAACVVSRSAPLADAAATALGNRIQDRSDIDPGLEWARSIEGVLGVMIVVGDRIGVWGAVDLVPLRPPKAEKKVEPRPGNR